MIVVDTNVLVRFLVNDHDGQHESAKQWFQDNSVYVLKTVLLETEWVLRGAFELSTVTIAQALQKVTMLSNVICEDAETVWQALDLYREGMDFADAIHLVSTPQDRVFITFDKKLAIKAKKAGLLVQLGL
jgi:predicted nucleic-acid-binding protein